MTPISDSALEHLRQVADRPELTGTRYEMLALLGRGGVGVVYEVMDLELHRAVAMKVLSDPDPDPAAIAGLLAEARVIAGLEHPGVVPVHDVGTLPDGRAFYTMKHVSGTRLDARVAEDPSLAERLRIFVRICETVAFAHARGVIHRDLKPENVMVGSFGEVLVMDWGLALRVSPSPAAGPGARATWDGSATPTRVAGTPGYMAPEQVRGEATGVDPRADIYSLGAVLYFLLTGCAPGSSARSARSDMLQQAQAGSALLPRQVDPGIPPALDSICRKATAEERSERYTSAAGLAADIGRFLDDGRVLAHRESASERVGRFARRHRVAIALVLAYLLMRVAVAFVRRA